METKTLTKKEKIKSLQSAVKVSKREDGTEYTHFSADAPEELKDLFLEHYTVRDLDYKIFSRACDLVGEIIGYTYERMDTPTQESIEEAIYERAPDSASVYTADRLEYLNVWNEEEISRMFLENGGESIANACAYWYDNQVEQAAIIINNWVNS